MSSKRLLVSLIISSPTTTASLTSILNPIYKQTTSNYFARRAPLTEEHHSRPTMRQENDPTFAYPPIHEPPQIPLASPDALTSSTRTDFTYYPPIEDLTRTLLKYAKTTNLRKLSYPTDLLSRR